MKRFAILAVSVLILLCCSCTGGPKLIPKSEFDRIYADMLKADAWLQDHRELRDQADTTLFYDAVFSMHGYTREDYLHSVSKYLEDPQEYSKILKQAGKIIDARIEELSQQKQVELEMQEAQSEPDGTSDDSGKRGRRHRENELEKIDQEI